MLYGLGTEPRGSKIRFERALDMREADHFGRIDVQGTDCATSHTARLVPGADPTLAQLLHVLVFTLDVDSSWEDGARLGRQMHPWLRIPTEWRVVRGYP